MSMFRVTCNTCGQSVAMTTRGRLYPHGSPRCPRRTIGRIWPTRHHGRHVQTIPGPDIWNPIEGAA